ncbi:MAG: inositol monophosphatase [Gammaproteobacteria bacterium]|jgi:myo-inositol-1(or 4)-monophosphatase|nr:inositol monophosphatase [Gammaproteobacteria bacterium]
MEPMANIALRAARIAGKHIVRGFDRPDLIDIETKGHNDFVTNIDRESEQIIIQTLREKYPDHKITGEESGSSDEEGADYEWVIDPLDGTTNFTRQLPHFCVSIACLFKGRVEHGVVVDPIREEEFVASRGQGARLNGKRIRVSGLENLDGALVATGGRDRQLFSDEEAAVYKELLEAKVFTRQPGSAALELCYIAAGRIDAMWMRGLGRWDIAAGSLLLTEAGGLIGDFEGGAGHMQTGNTVAGSPRCFKQLSQIVRKHLA